MFTCRQCGRETPGFQFCAGCIDEFEQPSRADEVSDLTEAQQQELESLVRECADLPRVVGSELSPDELEHREDFYRTDLVDGRRVAWSNNFHNLFLALYDQVMQPVKPLNPGEHRLKRVELTGQSWQIFLSDNQDLLEQMFSILERHPTYMRIRRLTFEVIRQHGWQEESLRSIHARFDPVVGIDCITMAFWRDLDPLLRQAWKAMEAAGVDPRTVDQ